MVLQWSHHACQALGDNSPPSTRPGASIYGHHLARSTLAPCMATHALFDHQDESSCPIDKCCGAPDAAKLNLQGSHWHSGLVCYRATYLPSDFAVKVELQASCDCFRASLRQALPFDPGSFPPERRLLTTALPGLGKLLRKLSREPSVETFGGTFNFGPAFQIWGLITLNPIA